MNQKFIEQISLESARVNAGFTIAEVSKTFNKTEKTIYNWENGKTPISAYMFFALCELYNRNPDTVRVPVIRDGKF